MQRVTSLLQTAMIALLFVVGFSVASADAPKTPVEFSAMHTDNNGSQVKVLWYSNKEGDAATSFDVYMAEGETEVMADFSVIANVKAEPDSPNKPRPAVYFHYVENLEPGIYTFFVKAVNEDGSSERTRIKVVRVEKIEAKVMFVTEPLRVGLAGKPYRYEAKAKANVVGSAVQYSIVNGPEGLTINAETGLLTWENPVAGEYDVEIKASLTVTATSDLLSGTQKFRLVIKPNDDNGGKDHCVLVSGTVSYDTDINEYLTGTVIAWALSVRKNDNGEPVEEYRPLFKAPIVKGKYEMRLPAGSYKFRIEGREFKAEWYNDVHEVAEAEVVVLNCEQEKTNLDFSVEALPKPVIVVVEGKVTDAETGEGIKALVVFEANNKEQQPAERFHRIAIETKEDGTYRAELQSGISFIAFAKSRPVNSARPAYLTEFFNETSDVTLAEVITLTESRGDINFTLDKAPVYSNSISGLLRDVDSAEIGLHGYVTAYLLKARIKEGKDTVLVHHAVVTVETDEQGNFSFSNLEPGDYIIAAKSTVRPYMPGWYVAGTQAATEWKSASVVGVDEVTVATEKTILLAKGKELRGKGRVRGWVYDKRGGLIGRTENNPTVKTGEQTQVSAGIVGTLVAVRDEQGVLIDAMLSTTEGTYEFNNMGIGVVKVTADRFGYTPETETAELSETNTDVEVSIGLIADVTSIDVPTDLVGTSVNLYPNPTSSTATIQFAAQQGATTVTVLSTAGVVLSTETVQTEAGVASLLINTNQLPQGLVMIQIRNGAHTFALPLSIVR